MLLLVIFQVVYTCMKFRKRAWDGTEPVHTKGNSTFEIVMIGGPLYYLPGFFIKPLQVCTRSRRL
jgi:heme/copper-type cytochrome/quinol oxidase subunit 2